MSIDSIASLKEALARKSEDVAAMFDANPTGLAIARDVRCEHVVSNLALDAILTPSFCWAPTGAQAEAVEMLHGGVPLAAEARPLWRAAALGEHVPAIELEIRVKGRPARIVVANATPLLDADGQTRGAIGSMVDITEQRARALEASEQGADSAAQATSRSRDEFLAMLGHELRNPLNAIATAIEVLNRAEAHAPVAVSARRIIGNQTRQLAGMMTRLLDVGHVLTNQVALRRQPMNLAAAVKRAVMAADSNARAKAQTLSLILAPGRLHADHAWINADADRIQQVLEQLLANAVKYTPEGGRIDVELGREDKLVLLRVSDTGDGIEPALLARIFEPLMQREGGFSRTEGGLGIGLTLVRRLVELHGGSVQARSGAGGAGGAGGTNGVSHVSDTTDADNGSALGSVFEVRLPTIAAPGPSAPESKRILLVDDNPDALYGLKSVLEFEGHHVQTAIDGPTGLAALLNGQSEIAILDIGLPGLDGYEIARRGRAGGFAGPLIALTGYGRARDVKRALAAGFDAHLVKPAEAEVLLRLIRG